MSSHSPPSSRADTHFELAGLATIDPSDLIRGTNDLVGEFFLALAVAYNDLKGIVYLEATVLDRGRPPDGQVSPFAGQYYGLIVQVHRWGAGVLHEIMRLVRENAATVAQPEFRGLLSKLSQRQQCCWMDLEEVALKRSLGTKPQTKLLARIRNEIGFHYYNPAALAHGFRAYFQLDARIPQNATAYYSPGRNLHETRFYYADAAAKRALDGFVAESGLGRDGVLELAVAFNEAVGSLLLAFVEERRRA